MNMSETQKAAVDELRQKHYDVVMGKDSLPNRIERALRIELAKLEIARTVSARTALSLGVPKTKIKQALNTTSWDTMTKVLEGK